MSNDGVRRSYQLGDQSTGTTADKLVSAHLRLVKSAWQDDQNELEKEKDTANALRNEIALMTSATELQTLRGDMGILFSSNTKNPCCFVDSIGRLLPEDFIDFLNLKCCIRSGNSWIIVGIKDSIRRVFDSAFDHSVSSMQTNNVYEIKQVAREAHGASNQSEDDATITFVVPVFPSACLWLLESNSADSAKSIDLYNFSPSRYSTLISHGSQSRHIKSDRPLSLGNSIEDRIARMLRAAGFLSGTFFSVLEAASQFCMSSLLHYLECQQTDAMLEDEMCRHIESNTYMASQSRRLEDVSTTMESLLRKVRSQERSILLNSFTSFCSSLVHDMIRQRQKRMSDIDMDGCSTDKVAEISNSSAEISSTSMSALSEYVRTSLPILLGVSEVSLVETQNENKTENDNKNYTARKKEKEFVSSHVESKSKNRLNEQNSDNSKKSRIVPINIIGEDEDVECSTISVAGKCTRIDASSYHLHLIKHETDEIPEPKEYEKEEETHKGGLFNESYDSQELERGASGSRSGENEAPLRVVLSSIGHVIRTMNECDTALHALLSMSSFRLHWQEAKQNSLDDMKRNNGNETKDHRGGHENQIGVKEDLKWMTTSMPDNQNALLRARITNIANKLDLENMNTNRQMENGQTSSGVNATGNRLDSISDVLNFDAVVSGNQEDAYTDSYKENIVGHRKCSPSSVVVLLNEVTRSNSGERRRNGTYRLDQDQEHQKKKKDSCRHDRSNVPIVRTCDIDTDPGCASPCRYWVPLGHPPGAVLELWEVLTDVRSNLEQNISQTLDLSLRNEERLYRIWPWGKKHPVEGSVRTESRTTCQEDATIRALTLWGGILSNAVNSFRLQMDHCNDALLLEEERERLAHQRDVLLRCHATLCVENVPTDWVINDNKLKADSIEMRRDFKNSGADEFKYDSNGDDGGEGGGEGRSVSEDNEGRISKIDSGNDGVLKDRRGILNSESNSKAEEKTVQRSRERERERDVRRCITWQCGEIKRSLDALGLTVCKEDSLTADYTVSSTTVYVRYRGRKSYVTAPRVAWGEVTVQGVAQHGSQGVEIEGRGSGDDSDDVLLYDSSDRLSSSSTLHSPPLSVNPLKENAHIRVTFVWKGITGHLILHLVPISDSTSSSSAWSIRQGSHSGAEVDCADECSDSDSDSDMCGASSGDGRKMVTTILRSLSHSVFSLYHGSKNTEAIRQQKETIKKLKAQINRKSDVAIAVSDLPMYDHQELEERLRQNADAINETENELRIVRALHRARDKEWEEYKNDRSSREEDLREREVAVREEASALSAMHRAMSEDLKGSVRGESLALSLLKQREALAEREKRDYEGLVRNLKSDLLDAQRALQLERESNQKLKDTVNTDRSMPDIPHDTANNPKGPLTHLRSPRTLQHFPNPYLNSSLGPQERMITSSPKGLRLSFLDPLESSPVTPPPSGGDIKGCLSDMVSPSTRMSTYSRE